MHVANAVGHYIERGYGKFVARSQADHTGQGQIYYVAPGSDMTPTVIVYEVTLPQDIQAIEALAAQALQAVPQARAVRLEFHERQNLSISPSGGGTRGWERPFKKVTVTRPSQTLGPS